MGAKNLASMEAAPGVDRLVAKLDSDFTLKQAGIVNRRESSSQWPRHSASTERRLLTTHSLEPQHCSCLLTRPAESGPVRETLETHMRKPCRL